MIVYIFTLFYIATNHSFNKIFLIWNQYFDNSAHLISGLSMWMLNTSSIFASSAKLMGNFVEYFNLRTVIITLFLLNAICIYICLSTQNNLYFIIFRNLQGYISGIQNSISSGLIGSLPKESHGFAKYTGLSAIISFLTVIVLWFSIDVVLIKWILVTINFLAACVFTVIDCNHPYKPIPIIKSVIIKVTSEKKFWYNSIIVGSILGIGLFLIAQQKFLLQSFFHILNHDLTTIISGCGFLVTSTLSFMYFLHKSFVVYLLFFISSISLLYGLLFNNPYFFIIGVISAFSIFTTINPILSNDVTTISEDKFVVSAYFFCVRSFFTFLSMSILSFLTPYNGILVSILFLTFLMIFYSFFLKKL